MYAIVKAMGVVDVSPDQRVIEGLWAWKEIKKSALTVRQQWLKVGKALLVGRELHPSNLAFSHWCIDKGFDMSSQVRSDAMWFAQQGASYTPCNTDEAHPSHIRQSHREQLKEAHLPKDLQELNIKPTVQLDQRTAERLAKVSNRAKSGGEGSDIAQRQYEAVAKKHGVTPEELDEAVSISAPEDYFQVSHQQSSVMNQLLQGLVHALEQTGLTKQAIRSFLIYAANSIKE